ncbi:hypothetical protein A2U01_0104375, partial [Trifolium medium]|nr:hypothetical protein [Trifolium medium]
SQGVRFAFTFGNRCLSVTVLATVFRLFCSKKL